MDACEGGCYRKGRNEIIRKVMCTRNGRYVTNVDHDGLGVRCMNELITKEMLEGGYVPEVIFDKLEEYKSAVEWFETFKYQFKKFCEEHGYSKWETDYFFMNYVGETTSVRVDTQRMKETNIYITDALTGELNEVNAYEFFSKKSVVKPHVTYKEKK